MINLNIEYTMFRIQISAEVCSGFRLERLVGLALLGMCLRYNARRQRSQFGVEVECMPVEHMIVGSNPARAAHVREMFF